MSQFDDRSAIELTAHIVAAYVENNPVPVSGLPALIASVSASVRQLAAMRAEAPATARKPAVNPKKSIFPDYIVCLEDGKKFKSLKRHLSVHFNLTPEEYRQKWDLPADYPMVAPNYSTARSNLARTMGLGRKAAAAASRAANGSKGGSARGRA